MSVGKQGLYTSGQYPYYYLADHTSDKADEISGTSGKV